jgi:hypothetical protein
MAELAQAMFESANSSPSESQKGGSNSTRLWEKLRMALTRFAGADGFSALFRRAVKLAQFETQTAKEVRIGPDGSINGVDQLRDEQSVALATCLLELLVTLIGERLTLRLVSDAWPELQD